MRIIYDSLYEFSKVAIRCKRTVDKNKCEYCPFFDDCMIDDEENRHVQCAEIEGYISRALVETGGITNEKDTD